jgi:Cd2+/Zn2+-exporting ATPase/Cu+-exporting ATPase
MWLGLLPPPVVQPAAILVLAVSSFSILKHAMQGLLRRRMTMELSMAIALVAAVAVGELFTALVILLFVLLAEALEEATVRSGRRSISSLLDLLPRVGTLKRDGDYQEVPIDDIHIGDVVLIRPGGRVIVDGRVLSGSSFVDEATITGEPFPVEKSPGGGVWAGTINRSGALEVLAEKVGQDTAFGKIVEAVESAERSRADVQRLADKLAGLLVLFALAAAALTLLVTHDLRQTISVVIVAGACGVAAGTPLAILGSIGRAARRGSIIKGGLYLERLAAVDTVVFDKTGTLTSGAPHVVAVHPVPGVSVVAVLQAAASAETLSEHPLAAAIVERAAELELPIEQPRTFSYVPGRGITVSGDSGEILVGNRALMTESGINGLPSEQRRAAAMSEVFVACNGRLLGSIDIADTVRPEARQAVSRLQALGIRTILLTGDTTTNAQAVAKRLGIDECAGELKPEDKRVRIEALEAAGRRTAMVGDGINDAPALTVASVGIAVGTGTDVALESADVVLIGGDLLRMVEAIKIARRCQRVIWTNFIGTIAVDSVGIGLAFFGLLNPLVAALVHVGSELAFLLNSARLFR